MIIVGQASERTVLDGYTISNPISFSAFFAKTGGITGVPIESRLPASINLAPNPTTNHTSVRWTGNYSSVQILEATGRIVREAPLKPSQTSADISLQNLSPGLYYIRLQGPSGPAVVRVVLRP